MSAGLPVQDGVIDEALRAHIDRVVAAEVERQLAADSEAAANCATLVVFSGDMDRLMAALVIAAGAVSMGMEVSLFFTFWGLTALRQAKTRRGKGWAERLLATVLPCGVGQAGPSRLNLWGAGRVLFKHMMRRKKVASLEDLLALVRGMPVRLVACQMSMDVMGISREELIPEVEIGGVAAYLGDARHSRVTLFV